MVRCLTLRLCQYQLYSDLYRLVLKVYVLKAFTRSILLLLITVLFSAQAKDVVNYNISKKFPDPKQAYYIDLLDLAMEKSIDKYGDYELVPVVFEMPQGRTSIMVQLNQGIDVTWRVTSQELEKRLQAIYVPLLKGMMGHRIFIINKGDQEKFSEDMTLSELRGLLAGQGYDWPDSIILQHNGINVVEGGAHKLLDMLQKRRFDYFPRALHEPWIEIADMPDLTVEENILIRYPAPFYFFVNRENTRLSERITYGLESALADGSFDSLFFHHPVTEDVMRLTKIHQRKIFLFTNPILSEKSQQLLQEPRYWISLSR